MLRKVTKTVPVVLLIIAVLCSFLAVGCGSNTIIGEDNSVQSGDDGYVPSQASPDDDPERSGGLGD